MAETREGFTMLYIGFENGHEDVIKEIFNYSKNRTGLKNALLLAESKAGSFIQI